MHGVKRLKVGRAVMPFAVFCTACCLFNLAGGGGAFVIPAVGIGEKGETKWSQIWCAGIRKGSAVAGGATEGVSVEARSQDDLFADEWTGFGEEDYDRFLGDYWQKRPLLIRNAIEGFQSTISPDELAGLACMDDVESRIIRGGKAKAEMMNMDWEVTHGPFEEEVFSQLGESHWTLLVNEVNRHLPEVSDLLGFFPFVPSWRVDDIMVSYAPDGGSVGPHVDNYDVFLLQGAGKRRWCIENRFTNAHEESKRSVKDIDVRVIADFTEDQDCMTYSVGFRAPSTKDMLTFFGEHAASTLTDVDAFYCDPDLKRQDNPGLISRSSVERSKEMLREAFVKALSDDKAFETWFGAHITRSLRDHSGYPVAMDPHELSVGYQTPDDVLRAIKAARGDRTGPFIYRSEGLTFAYIEHGRENNRADFADEGVTLFIDGNNFPLEASLAPLARLLCSSSRFTPQDIQPALDGPPAKGVEALLKGLILEGYLYPADD